jgi:hypothetical protein
MNVNWNAKIQKLADDINWVLNKERKISMVESAAAAGGTSSTAGEASKKAVKFQLPEDYQGD